MGALMSCRQTSVSQNLLPSNQSRPVMKLLLIGLDNAGKTTAVMHLLGNPIDDVVPTVGFSSVDMKQFNKFKVQIYDLGGGPKIRGIWKNYFALVHGLIYVIDSADANRVSEVKECLTEVVSSEKVAKKPILILINKQDIEGALDEVDMLKELNVEVLVNKHECPTKIESCSASANYDPTKNQKDAGLDQGYFWLVKHIVRNWDELNERVERESNEQIEIEKQIMKERFKRFRSKADQDQQNASDDVEGAGKMNGNPFKPIKEVIHATKSSSNQNSVPPTLPPVVVDPRGTTTAKPSPKKRVHRSPQKEGDKFKNNDTAGQEKTATDAATEVVAKEAQVVVTSSAADKNGSIVPLSDLSPSPEKKNAERHRQTADLTKRKKSSGKKRKPIFRSNKVSPFA